MQIKLSGILTPGVAGVEEHKMGFDVYQLRSFHSCFRSQISALASSQIHEWRLRGEKKQGYRKHTPLLHRDSSQTKR